MISAIIPRPWGHSVIIAQGLTDNNTAFCEKQITLLSGHILSLQSHRLRNETWTVISGTLTVILKNKKIILQSGQKIFIPANAIHAMANISHEDCIIHERQEGVCDEDDIVRYHDAYGRAITTTPFDDKITDSLNIYQSILSELP